LPNWIAAAIDTTIEVYVAPSQLGTASAPTRKSSLSCSSYKK
jgi:hypothetical protein